MYNLPKGFLASGIHSCIKKKNIKDLALIYSTSPATASGLFTLNTVRAAPVIYSEKIIKSNRIRAIIINSGCANACTGKKGIADIELICRELAKRLDIHPKSIIMASTGVIGEPLPIKNILSHLPELLSKLSPDGLKNASEAILTTDTFPKVKSKRIKFPYGSITITGFAKGAGMIQPDMATMLAFVLTDAEIEKGVLSKMLRESVESSFNRITVDGEMSTNDSVIALANGVSGVKIENKKDIEKFQSALTDICLALAEMIVSDGEGATHVVKIEVRGARTISNKKKIAYKIGNSPLVKTAIFGRDPNWGRIMASAGSAGVRFDPGKVDIYFDSIQVVKNGISAQNDKRARKVMEKKNYTITLNLNSGTNGFYILTTDLTHEYIRVNASYKT